MIYTPTCETFTKTSMNIEKYNKFYLQIQVGMSSPDQPRTFQSSFLYVCSLIEGVRYEQNENSKIEVRPTVYVFCTLFSNN